MMTDLMTTALHSSRDNVIKNRIIFWRKPSGKDAHMRLAQNRPESKSRSSGLPQVQMPLKRYCLRIFRMGVRIESRLMAKTFISLDRTKLMGKLQAGQKVPLIQNRGGDDHPLCVRASLPNLSARDMKSWRRNDGVEARHSSNHYARCRSVGPANPHWTVPGGCVRSHRAASSHQGDRG